MKYALHFGPETLVIELEGTFTFLDSRVFHRMMSAIAANEGRSTIHLDVKQLKKVDATGLRLLMLAHDAAKKNHRPLIFERPQGQVATALNEAAKYNRLNIAA